MTRRTRRCTNIVNQILVFSMLLTRKKYSYATVQYEQEYVVLKDKIREEMGIADLAELFAQVERRLQIEVKSISEYGSDIIPVTTYDEVKNNNGRFSQGVADEVRRRGVVVVREVIPMEEMDSMVASLLKYMYDNNAFPPAINQVR